MDVYHGKAIFNAYKITR